MYIALNIRAVNKSTQLPLVGVLIKVYSLDLATEYVSDLTDDEGLAYGLVPEESEFEVRAFRDDLRRATRSKLTSQAYADGVSQAAKLELIAPSVQDSADPRMCRVWERFLGSPFPGGFVHVAMRDAVIVSDEGVRVPRPIPGKIENGFYAVELPVGALVQFGIPGSEGQVEVEIPDTRSLRLSDLLFPYLVSIVYGDPVGAELSVGVGDQQEEEVSAVFSDTTTKPINELAGQWLVTKDGEESTGLVVTTTSASKIMLEGKEAGSYEVTFSPSVNGSFFPTTLAAKRLPSPPTPLHMPMRVTVA